MDNRDFLGVGWDFPVNADNASGKIKTSKYEDNIAQAVHLILNTSKGERLMRPDFGSRLRSYIFETTSLYTLSMIEEEVKDSLILWEPRIRDIDVTATENREISGCINIAISYIIRATNNPYNLVFPFYLKEG